jgi:hypothetical protein
LNRGDVRKRLDGRPHLARHADARAEEDAVIAAADRDVVPGGRRARLAERHQFAAHVAEPLFEGITARGHGGSSEARSRRWWLAELDDQIDRRAWRRCGGRRLRVNRTGSRTQREEYRDHPGRHGVI